MAAEGMSAVLAAAATGLALSVAVERRMTPRPPWGRPRAAWALHAGSWLMAHALLTLPLGRPWFAAAAVIAFLLMVVLVNNAKFHALREPFVFQDFEYFSDAIRHPRLYIPFLGWGKFLGATAGFTLAVAIGLWGETVPVRRFEMAGQWGGVAAVGLAGVLLWLAGRRGVPAVSFDAQRDIESLGLVACLWRYAEAARQPIRAVSPFSTPVEKPSQAAALPHLVAVQSESFFDPRGLYAGIRPEVLAAYDALRDDAVAHGRLRVPAWGANTVRTEFAFLCGIEESALGVHRFNPYRAIAGETAQPAPASLASCLKRMGYRTVCLHPYPAGFYLRDRVYPRLGFDEFLDIRAFAGAKREGPYIADAAVAERIAALLGSADKPLFIFAITMENHGPLHLERVGPADEASLYSTPPPAGCDDLTIYLRHLRNADRMLGEVRRALAACPRPASLCWFGDHVPIMPAVYQTLGTPEGDVGYVLWSNQSTPAPAEQALPAHALARAWLRVQPDLLSN